MLGDDTRQPVDITTAGTRLHEHLFGTLPALPFPGNVCVGTDRLFVYATKRWRGTKTTEWQGYLVEWRENVGIAKAQ